MALGRWLDEIADVRATNDRRQLVVDGFGKTEPAAAAANWVAQDETCVVGRNAGRATRGPAESARVSERKIWYAESNAGTPTGGGCAQLRRRVSAGE